MNPQAKLKIEALRKDFAGVSGRPFAHFFCPFLFQDEVAPLCKAHIVNTAFPESSRRWTLQRQDVDNFFGAVFESDFVDLRHEQSGLSLEAVINPSLYKRLRPQILLDGKSVEHFLVKGPIPREFATITIEEEGRTARLAVKMSPVDVESIANLTIEVSKDIRLAAVVSVLKAAHLTLFELLGYRYALGCGGQYL